MSKQSESALEKLYSLKENANNAEEAKEVATMFKYLYIKCSNELDEDEDPIIYEDVMLNAVECYMKAYKYGDYASSMYVADCYLILAHTGSLKYADEAIKWCEIAKKLPNLDDDDIAKIDKLLIESLDLKQEIIKFINNSRSKNKETKKAKSIWLLLIGILLMITCFSTESLWSGAIGAILLYIYFKK